MSNKDAYWAKTKNHYEMLQSKEIGIFRIQREIEY